MQPTENHGSDVKLAVLQKKLAQLFPTNVIRRRVSTCLDDLLPINLEKIGKYANHSFLLAATLAWKG
jgi:hypothetical protein